MGSFHDSSVPPPARATRRSRPGRYLEKAATAGLTWPLPEDLDDQRLDITAC
jgi:hypothetical protein